LSELQASRWFGFKEDEKLGVLKKVKQSDQGAISPRAAGWSEEAEGREQEAEARDDTDDTGLPRNPSRHKIGHIGIRHQCI
jgi:hypothetical protein